MAARQVALGASATSRPKSRPLRENPITRKGRHRPSLRLAPRRRCKSRSRRKLCRCLRKPCLKARAHEMDGDGEWAIKDKKKTKKMKQKKKSYLAPPKPNAGLQRGQPRWLCAQRAATYPLRGRKTSRRRLRTLLQLKRRRLLRRRRGPKAARRRCRPGCRPGGLPPRVAEPLAEEA
jgi:hypothetical protein